MKFFLHHVKICYNILGGIDMKIKIFAPILLIIIVFLLAGCNSKEVDYRLQIKESSWSGWSEDYKPEEVTNEYDVVLGKEYKTNSGKFVFKIKEIKKNSIIIETQDVFSDNEDGIDLNSKKKEFEVTFDKEIKLTTPTMDEGDIYYLKLVK